MKMFELSGVRVGLSDRADGNMKVLSDADETKVMKNRGKFLSKMELSEESTYFVRVGYDTDNFCRFMWAGKENSLRLDRKAERCDGLLACERGVGLFLPLADCAGVVLFDGAVGAMMVVHCGRHTVVQDGALKAVRYMAEEVGTNPKDLFVWLSPSAGSGNYPIHDLGGMSLQEAVMGQLMRAGINKANIQTSDIDTTVHDHYFSHSQGDEWDRFAIVAVIDGSDVK